MGSAAGLLNRGVTDPRGEEFTRRRRYPTQVHSPFLPDDSLKTGSQPVDQSVSKKRAKLAGQQADGARAA
jgi:hypothetical protein